MKGFLLFLTFISTACFAQTNSAYHYDPPVEVGDGLSIASLTKVGIDSNRIIALTNKIMAGYYINIHSLLILRYNKLVYENYFHGSDAMIVFGADDKEFVRAGSSDPLSSPKDSLHDARSISKSVVSACIGIAIAQGKIKSVDESIWNYFPEYKNLDTGLKSTITIRNLLTMTSGLDLNEGVPYSDSANTERLTNRSADPIRFILSRRSVDSPGKSWNYSGGCTELLAAIIHRASGLEIDTFANEYLFKPLGIPKFNWMRLPSTSTRQGAPAAASGLRLTSRDLAKFGLLYLNKGKWKNNQLIAADWIEQSHQYYFQTKYPETFYGFQFWCADATINNSQTKVFAAQGNGGQWVVMIPTLELTIVVTAGNYGNNQLSSQSYAMIENEIYPAIQKEK